MSILWAIGYLLLLLLCIVGGYLTGLTSLTQDILGANAGRNLWVLGALTAALMLVLLAMALQERSLLSTFGSKSIFAIAIFSFGLFLGYWAWSGGKGS